MSETSSEDYLVRAEEHLERVYASWDAPTDWGALTIFGFYCVEAAVMAATSHSGLPNTRNHREKAKLAQRLHKAYNLPDVSSLLKTLNVARKAAAYGDVEAPELDAQDLLVEIETFVDSVRDLVRQGA